MLKEKLRQFYEDNKPNPEYNEISLTKFFDFYNHYALSYYQFKITPFFLSTEANITYKEANDFLLFFSNEDYNKLTPIEANLYIDCPNCPERIFPNEDEEIICDYCGIEPEFDDEDIFVQFNVNENFVKTIKKDIEIDTIQSLKDTNHPLAEGPLSSNEDALNEGDLSFNDIAQPPSFLSQRSKLIKKVRS